MDRSMTSELILARSGTSALSVKSRFKRMLNHSIAIDLGTANTLVYLDGQGIVINEPSVVAANLRTKKVVAVGRDADNMIGRAPDSIKAIRPLKNGIVSNYEMAEHMIRDMLGRLHSEYRVLLSKPHITIGLPSGVTEVEKRAVEEAARAAGSTNNIQLIEEPVAAAIGAGIDINDGRGSMVIDIGGGTTEMAVIANGRPVIGSSLRLGGSDLTDSITSFIRDEYNLLVGEHTAEQVKLNIGAVFVHPDKKTMAVRGRNTITGLPQEIEVRSDILRLPLTRQMRPILDTVKAVIEQTPPELLSDVMEGGLVLAGGGAFMAGVGRLIEQETHIKVVVAQNSLTAVVEGAAKAMLNPNDYGQIISLSSG